MSKRGKHSRNTNYWPNFESIFLSDILQFIRRRSKSIKHRVQYYSCEKVIIRFDGNDSLNDIEEDVEQLQLHFEFYAERRLWMSCHIRSDRWIWIDVSQVGVSRVGGWAFEWSHEGRIGDVQPQKIAEAIDYSITNVNRLGVIETLWKKIVLDGPKGVAF